MIGALIVIVLLLGGYILYSGGVFGGGMATTTPFGTPTPTPTPSPTPPGAEVSAPEVQTDSRAVVSNSTAVVTGRVTPNGAPSTYWYEYGPSTALGQRTSAQSIGSGYSTIPSPGYITGLSANTTYYFRLSAQNRIGVVNGATHSFITNSTPPPQGAAPSASSQSATDVERTTAQLNGRVDANGAQTTYWFEWGDDTNFGRITSLQSAGNNSSAVSVSAAITGLNPLTRYYFRINAQNQFGTVNGATQSFTTKGPAAPGAPSVDTTAATKVTVSSAQLNGRIHPNGAETTYWFEYSEDSLLASILGTATVDQKISAGAGTQSVSADVSGLKKDTRYFFRIVGKNDFGTVRGDIVTFRTRS